MAPLIGIGVKLIAIANQLQSHKTPAIVASRRQGGERGFAMAGVAEDGLAGLCRFFDAITAAARRSLDIRCVKCPRLGADESALLQMVAHLHHGAERGAAMLLEDWLPQSAVRIALAPLADFAAALSEAGLVVLRRHGGAGLDLSSATACPDRGVALVH